MKLTKALLESTAKDYDMDVENVELIAKTSSSMEKFYKSLEEHINTRIKI